jgi:hypothetical protein
MRILSVYGVCDAHCAYFNSNGANRGKNVSLAMGGGGGTAERRKQRLRLKKLALI